MEDMYYLTASPITVQELGLVATSIGLQTQMFDMRNRTYLNVLIPEEEFWWQTVQMLSQDTESLSFGRSQLIKPLVGFFIAYRVGAEPWMITYFKKVLNQFGGWVDCATESPQGVFTLDNIGTLDCITLLMEEPDTDE